MQRDATTVVIGLDGAHFELLEPWLEKGELPNIQDAIEGGISGDLVSVLPPVTSPNWKCYSTGKNPGKLGIFWWENIDVDRQQIYYPNTRKAAHKQYWENIAETNNVGVVGVPLTFPPREFEGFLVAGAPDGEESAYTHPPELENELNEKFNYRVTKRNRISMDQEQAVDEILDLIELRFEVGTDLLFNEDLDFLQVTTFYINSLHHFLWDDEATLAAWKIVDEYVGKFLEEDYNVVMMSDHGSTEIDWEFHVNSWLKEQGLLKTEMSFPKLLHKLGITTDRLIKISTTLGISKIAKLAAPDTVLQYIPNENQEITRERKGSHINWSDTSAIASGQGPIYLTTPKDSDRYDQIRDNLIQKLQNLTTPSGYPVAKEVHRSEEIYEGEYQSEAPDIVVDQVDGIHISGRIGRGKVFTSPEDDTWRAENKRRGMLIANGPDFAEGDINEISILDLAPTLLHLFDCSVPADLDGQVQDILFASDSEASNRAVEYSDHFQEPHVEEIRRIARGSNL